MSSGLASGAAATRAWISAMTSSPRIRRRSSVFMPCYRATSHEGTPPIAGPFRMRIEGNGDAPF